MPDIAEVVELHNYVELKDLVKKVKKVMRQLKDRKMRGYLFNCGFVGSSNPSLLKESRTNENKCDQIIPRPKEVAKLRLNYHQSRHHLKGKKKYPSIKGKSSVSSVKNVAKLLLNVPIDIQR